MNKLTQEHKTEILFALFIAALICANLLGAKITAFSLPAWLFWPLNIAFWPLIAAINLVAAALPQYTISATPFLHYDFFNTIHVSVGILTVPIMFLIPDVIGEVFGKAKARQFIRSGVVAMLFVILIAAISVALPADPQRQYFSQEGYSKIFGTSIRIAFASILAFTIAELNDIWTFLTIKIKTQGRFLWLRNNASSIVSQFIDSTIFMFVAFFHLTPSYTALFIFSLIIPYWIFKILFSIIETPLCYALVRWLKNTPDTSTP